MRTLLSARSRVLEGVALVVAVIGIGLVAGRHLVVEGDTEVLEDFIENRTGAVTVVMKLVTTAFNPRGRTLASTGSLTCSGASSSALP